MVKSRNSYSILVVFVIGILLYPSYIEPILTDLEQEFMFALFPSGERAYVYGNVHLDPNRPVDYNIKRAEFFFEKAAELDSHLPYIYHQLARVAFLNSNFFKAKQLIDMQISSVGDSSPPSYYVRGLIEGYIGDYTDAEKDYSHYLSLQPDSWAGMNDYAWVLLKDNKPQIAADVTTEGIKKYPENPWLLNSNATALYEMGDIADASVIIQRASSAVANLSPSEWSHAYPGNNPDIASEGIATFKKAVADNMHMILSASSTKPSV